MARTVTVDPTARRALRGDAGSGTVLALAVIAVAMLLAGVLGGLATVQGARTGAQTAADLAALAGAGSLALPAGLERAPGVGEDPCVLARRVVERNEAELSGCRADGPVVTVSAERPTAFGTARAVARAGPVSSRG